MFEVITLDLDDTLWDPRPALLRAENAQYAWLAEHAPQVAARYSKEDLRSLRADLAHRRPREACDMSWLRRTALVQRLVEFDLAEELADEGMRVFHAERSAVELYPDVRPALHRLSQRYRLLALTNGNADIHRAGVGNYFVGCISPAQAGFRKPEPEIFAHALTKVGAVAGRAVHIGDHPVDDIEGGRGAGMWTIWINRAQQDWPDALPPADAEIPSLAELELALDRLVAM